MTKQRIMFIFSLLVMLATSFMTLAEAGNLHQNVYLGLFGSSNVVSINYDSRFSGTSVFGWRAGIGYANSNFDQPKSHQFFNYRSGFSLPLGVNALFGKHSSKFEIGVGFTPSLVAFRESVTIRDEDERSEYTHDIGPTSWRGASAFGIDLGYRLQRRSGFMFRVGISPCVDVNKTCVSIHVLSLVPYLGFGWFL